VARARRIRDGGGLIAVARKGKGKRPARPSPEQLWRGAQRAIRDIANDPRLRVDPEIKRRLAIKIDLTRPKPKPKSPQPKPKRMGGRPRGLTDDQVASGIRYLRDHPKQTMKVAFPALRKLLKTSASDSVLRRDIWDERKR
jgi:hypothetical protein